MADDPNIDFDRLQTLLDVVHKLSTIAPSKTALIAMAMAEIHKCHLDADKFLQAEGKERLAAEQEAANRLNAERRAMEENTPPLSRPPEKNLTVVPGEPLDPEIIQETDEPGSIVRELEEPSVYPKDSGVEVTQIDRRA